jgi:5'-deoxynucleotidase YfbR-like HD superfamily hydrolase
LLAIWPDAPRDAIVYAMFHDIGEVKVGDMPWGMKNLDPVIREAMDEGEEKAYRDMVEKWFLPAPVSEPLYKDIFKLAETIEMWEWGLSEYAMGNTYAGEVTRRTADHARELIAALHKRGEIYDYVGHMASCYMTIREAHEDMIREKNR